MTKSLTGRFVHLCPDWDYLEIDETVSEFECCACSLEGRAEWEATEAVSLSLIVRALKEGR